MWRHSPSQQLASQESQKISPFWRRPAQSQNSNACQRDDLTLKNEQLELEIQQLRENVDKLMVDITSKAITIKAQQSQKTPHTSSKGDEKATSPARATPSKDLINIYDDVTRDIERELMNIIHNKGQECDYLAQRLAEREISAENALMQLNTSRRVQQHLQTTCSSFLSELAHEFAHVSHELRGQQRQHAALEEHRKMAEQGLKQLTGVLEEKQTAIDSSICPHTTILLYVSSYCYTCPHTTMCPQTGVLEEKQTAIDSLQTRLSTSEDALAVLSESSKLAKGENNRLKDELGAIRQRDTQVLSLLALMAQKYKYLLAGCPPPKGQPGAQFTCFTGTKVRILTQLRRRSWCSGCLLYWYKSANTDAAKRRAGCLPPK